MAYIDVPFPVCVSMGAVSTSDWAVDIATSQSGVEQRNRYTSQARHHFDCALAVRTTTDFKQVRNHWHLMRGRENSFPFKDPVDNTVTGSEGGFQILTGVGQLQLVKVYGDYRRKITRPINVQILSNGAPIAPSRTNGLVTLSSDQTRTITAHTAGAAHKFTLATPFTGGMIGDLISVSGVTGTAAAILNGKNLAITAISGSDVTVAVATTGLTATGGTASHYPSGLSWSGDFYTPCRYNMVGLPASAVNRRGGGGDLLVAVDQLTLIEVVE